MSGNRGLIVSDAQFRRMWFDRSLTVAQIGMTIGISQAAVTSRARVRQLPDRHAHHLIHPKFVITDDDFAVMWNAGISAEEIAARFSCHLKTVRNTRFRLDLKPRHKGWRPKMTMAEFKANQILKDMAATARADRAAWENAEMVDGLHPGRRRLVA